VFTEILKIIPRLDPGDLAKMERALTTRFGRIAKRFGKGLAGALKGGGIAGLAVGLIDKLLNPLKEVQESIDKVLKQGDDVVTNAAQFNTTAGKLFKLTQLGKSTGIQEDDLYMLMAKFQTSIAEAEADPKKKTSVRQFVGEKDTAEAFFQFIQSLQKMDKNQQILVQQEVFGEKQILKMADFLQTDFTKQLKLIGAKGGDAYTPGLEKLAGLNDLADALEAKRTLDDTMAKSRVINEGIVKSRDSQIRAELDRENERIKSYQSLATISETSTKIFTVIERGMVILTDMATKMSGLTEYIKKFSGKRLLRGIFGGDGE
jgi:hypothetical protein